MRSLNPDQLRTLTEVVALGNCPDAIVKLCTHARGELDGSMGAAKGSPVNARSRRRGGGGRGRGVLWGFQVRTGLVGCGGRRQRAFPFEFANVDHDGLLRNAIDKGLNEGISSRVEL